MIMGLRNRGVAELERATFLGRATHCNAEFYSFRSRECPWLMREVCRCRDEAFRAVGVAMDTPPSGDAVDMSEGCMQVVLWDVERKAVMGGYRYILGRDVSVDSFVLYRDYFLTSQFVSGYMDDAMELGRSFITTSYMRGAGVHTIYVLDALWEALGRIVVASDVRYLFGRVTLYPSLTIRERNLLVGFMRYVYPSHDALFVARQRVNVGIGRCRCREIFTGESVEDNYRILLRQIRSLGGFVPPIISSYMRLSPTMQTFDACSNEALGGVVEVAIMLTVDDFYDGVKRRYLSYCATAEKSAEKRSAVLA